jgi:hypothetical protein
MKQLALFTALLFANAAIAGWTPPDDSWKSLFNGKDFSNWKLPDKEHNWKIVDGVIDYEAKGGNLVSEKSFKNYKLHIEWRFKRTEGKYTASLVDGDGKPILDANGKQKRQSFDNADSGIYLRGTGKSQTNIWCWPCGSGQFWSYKGHKDPKVKAAAWPDKPMDKPVGEWNVFDITVKGEEIAITLNGEVIMQPTVMPAIGTEGPIALQHHGGYNEKSKKWSNASSIIQFRNIWIKELD